MLNLKRFSRPLVQFVVMIAMISIATALTFSMIGTREQPERRPAFKTSYSIETVIAERSDHQPFLVSYGETVAGRTIDLRPLVSGEIVMVHPNLRAGAKISKGDILFSVDEFNYQGALIEAKANLAQARAKKDENKARITLEQARQDSLKEQRDLAQSDLSRITTLRESDISTQQQVDVRTLTLSQREQALTQSDNTIRVEHAKLDQMNAELDRLQWRLDQSKRNLQNTKLIAPFDGIVRSSAAEVGRFVNGNETIISLYEGGVPDVRFTLSDNQYGRIQSDESGMLARPIEIVWNIGGTPQTWQGKINRLGADISSRSGGIEVFAILTERASNNASELRPGAFVEVRVPDKLFKDTISIPTSSIYDGTLVYVVKDGKLEERMVLVVSYDDKNALVSTGIEAGDEILITRISEVSAGLNVNVVGGSQ